MGALTIMVMCSGDARISRWQRAAEVQATLKELVEERNQEILEKGPKKGLRAPRLRPSHPRCAA
jgi:hypothetical protein